jgi:hypothetical protein
METGDHFKNGASSKSQTSRINKSMKPMFLVIILCLFVTSAIGNDLTTKEKKSGTDLPLFVGVGFRSLSVKPLNEAL